MYIFGKRVSISMMTIEIPVLPHVKSLMLSLYGCEPFAANENNVLGKEIESVLISYSQTEMFPEKIVGEKVKMVVSTRVAGYYLRFQNAFDLGCFFEKQFHLLLYNYVEAQMECGIRQETAIKNFYNKHSIDPELYDIIAARMSLMRMRKRKEISA